jgi:hypothetical protein
MTDEEIQTHRVYKATINEDFDHDESRICLQALVLLQRICNGFNESLLELVDDQPDEQYCDLKIFLHDFNRMLNRDVSDLN